MNPNLKKVIKRVRSRGLTINRAYWVSKQGPEQLDKKNNKITLREKKPTVVYRDVPGGRKAEAKEVTRFNNIQKIRQAKKYSNPHHELTEQQRADIKIDAPMTHSKSKAIASNPNTPPDVLEKLAEKHPKEVWRNPARFMAQLENPGFMKPANEYAAGKVVKAVAEKGFVDKDFLEHIGHKGVSNALQHDVSLSKPAIPDESLKALHEFAKNGPEAWSFNHMLARHPNLSPEHATKLMDEWRGADEYGLMAKLARHPNTPDKVLKELVADAKSSGNYNATSAAASAELVDRKTIAAQKQRIATAKENGATLVKINGRLRKVK